MLNYKAMYEELLQQKIDNEELLKEEIYKLQQHNEMLKSQNFSLMQDNHYNYIFR
jgi:hypothetical protein